MINARYKVSDIELHDSAVSEKEKDMFEIEIIDTYERFLKIKSIWNSTLRKSKNENVFLRHEWFKCWWESFGKNKWMYILNIIKDGRTIALAPFMITRELYRGIPVNKLKFISNEHSFRCEFIISSHHKTVLQAIFDHVWNCREKWDVIELENIPEDSTLFLRLIRLFNLRNYVYGKKEGLNSPYLKIHTSWDYYRSNLSKRFKRNLSAKENRIKKAGSYTVEEIKRFDDSFYDILEISEKSWKSKIGKAISDSEDTIKFFINLTKTAFRKGWLSIWLLKINNMPAAYEYQLVYKNKAYAMKSDFDEKFSEQSPGFVLNHHIMKSRFDSNISEYDLGGSNNSYKMNWQPKIRHHENFIICRKNLPGLLVYTLEFKLIQPLRKITTPIRNIYRKVRDIYRYEGIKNLSVRIINRVLSFMISYNSAVWFEKDLTEETQSIETKIPVELDLHSGTRTIDWIEKQKKSWLINEKEILTGVILNHYFPTALHNGKIIGYVKVGFNAIYITDYNRIMSVPDDMVFIYDTYILQKYRGKGVAPFIISETLKHMKNMGYKYVRCHIPKWNKSSIRAYKKLNFREVNFIRCIKIFGIPIITAAPFKRYYSSHKNKGLRNALYDRNN
jgi:CelD/BcsL family acetyltransferase involved in cellulose biosynthesis/ribosomal protein S18 acetylase RimI-like enzyme